MVGRLGGPGGPDPIPGMSGGPENVQRTYVQTFPALQPTVSKPITPNTPLPSDLNALAMATVLMGIKPS